MTTSKTRMIAFSAAIALLMPLSLHATPRKSARSTVGQEARGTLLDIRTSADAAAAQAEKLELYIANLNVGADAQLVPILDLKDDVNKIGEEVNRLEAERGSLSPWEQKALDKVIPLAQAAAIDARSTIEYFNRNKPHLWTPEYRAYADKALSDSHQIANTLRDYFKYEKAREEERQLQARVGAGAN